LVLRQITLLVDEDNRFLRIAIERTFTKAGYSVLSAEDGQEALRIAREVLPELILLDMMLPKIAGPNVLELLKEDATTQHIPVVVLSGLSQKNDAKLLAAGAAAYFEKSESLLDKNGGLLQIVERLVGKPLALTPSSLPQPLTVP
jgi:CheY-like chemotaxis protein